MRKFCIALLLLVVLLGGSVAQADLPHRFMDIAPGANEAKVIAALSEQGIQLEVAGGYVPGLVSPPGQVSLYGMPTQLRIIFSQQKVYTVMYEIALREFRTAAPSRSDSDSLEGAIAYTQQLAEKLTEKCGPPTGGIMYTGAGDSAVWDYPGDPRTGELDGPLLKRLVREESLVDITLFYDNISLQLYWESYDDYAGSLDQLEVSVCYDYQWETEPLRDVVGFAQGYGPYSDEGKAAHLEDVHR